MGYLHEHQIVHGGLCLKAVRIGPQGDVRLADYGVAPLSAADTTLDVKRYAAPEILQDCCCVSPAADVYSLGIILAELISGTQPFANYSTLPQLMDAVCLHDERPMLPGPLYAEVGKAWNVDRFNRTTADNLQVMLVDAEDSDDEDEEEEARVQELVRRGSVRRQPSVPDDEPSWVKPAQDSPAPGASAQRLKSSSGPSRGVDVQVVLPVGETDTDNDNVFEAVKVVLRKQDEHARPEPLEVKTEVRK